MNTLEKIQQYPKKTTSITNAPERVYLSHHGAATVWPDNAEPAPYIRTDLYNAAVAERDAALAQVERLKGAAEYILDGMGIDGPDYTIPDDDDFLDAANGPWVLDTLTRLAAALAEDAKP